MQDSTPLLVWLVMLSLFYLIDMWKMRALEAKVEELEKKVNGQ